MRSSDSVILKRFEQALRASYKKLTLPYEETGKTFFPVLYSRAKQICSSSIDNYGNYEASEKQAGDEQIVYRSNHGLAHTARTMILVPHVLAFHIKHAKPEIQEYLLDKTSTLERAINFIMKLQIAMAFYVSGREGEDGFGTDKYNEYRRKSKEYFLDYVGGKESIEKLFETPEEIELYGDCIEFPYIKPDDFDTLGEDRLALKAILYGAHCADLVRVWSPKNIATVAVYDLLKAVPDEYKESLKGEAFGIFQIASTLCREMGDSLHTDFKYNSSGLLEPCKPENVTRSNLYVTNFPKTDLVKFMKYSTIPGKSVDLSWTTIPHDTILHKLILGAKIEAEETRPVRQALTYSYTNFLNAPFNSSTKRWPALYRKNGTIQYDELYDNTIQPSDIVHRPNHGLAYTSRIVSMVPYVVAFHLKHARTEIKNYLLKQTTDNYETRKFIAKLKIAMVFYASGRAGEEKFGTNEYLLARKKSREHFAEYVKSDSSLLQLFKNEEEFNLYGECLENSYIYLKEWDSPYDDAKMALKAIMYGAHCIDLVRIWDPQRIKDETVCDFLTAVPKKEEKALRSEAFAIFERAAHLCLAMGDSLKTHFATNSNGTLSAVSPNGTNNDRKTAYKNNLELFMKHSYEASKCQETCASILKDDVCSMINKARGEEKREKSLAKPILEPAEVKIQEDKIFAYSLHALQVSNSMYLGTPYTHMNAKIFPVLYKRNGKICSAPYDNHKSEVQNSDEQIVYRSNHGLAHTARAMSVVPYVIALNMKYAREEVRKYLQTQTASWEDSQKFIIKLQIAMAFYVSGRRGEQGFKDPLYTQYRVDSKKYFLDYVNKNEAVKSLFKEGEIELYGNCLEHSYILDEDWARLPAEAMALKAIMYGAHCVDLVRQWDPYKKPPRPDGRVIASIKEDTLYDLLRAVPKERHAEATNEGYAIFQQAAILCRSMGDSLKADFKLSIHGLLTPCDPEALTHSALYNTPVPKTNLEKFLMYSTDVQKCLEHSYNQVIPCGKIEQLISEAKKEIKVDQSKKQQSEQRAERVEMQAKTNNHPGKKQEPDKGALIYFLGAISICSTIAYLGLRKSETGIASIIAKGSAIIAVGSATLTLYNILNNNSSTDRTNANTHSR